MLCMRMNQRLKLQGLRSVTLQAENLMTQANCIWVTVSGYEERSRFFAETWLGKSFPKPSRWAAIGFKEHSSILSRPENDAFYRRFGQEPHLLSTSEYNDLENYLRPFLDRTEQENHPLTVHVDYSCMPRNWYCNLVSFFDDALLPGDRVYFWYSAGEYPQSDYPTAGVSDFTVYSGTSRLNSRFRAHFFGLGFDRVRASAIYSVIDPQYLVCYYADPGVKPEYVAKVQRDNEQILKDAQLIANVPVNDFSATFDRLCALSNEFLESGDVIIVPDGPKPLVLASSLVPRFLGKAGVICFHVARRKTAWEPVQVKALGEVFGFSFQARPDDAI
jgi:hypothetical protein